MSAPAMPQPAPGTLAAPMTPEEVAPLLHCCLTTVRRMALDGRLPRVPGSRKVLIPRAAVEAVLRGETPPRTTSRRQWTPGGAR